MQKVGENTLIGASGDLSDYQKIMKMVQEMQTGDMAHDDGCSMTPRDFHQYMGRVMYNRSLCVRTECKQYRLKRRGFSAQT
jgi:20S proteasome subunit beta 7